MLSGFSFALKRESVANPFDCQAKVYQCPIGILASPELTLRLLLGNGRINRLNCDSHAPVYKEVNLNHTARKPNY